MIKNPIQKVTNKLQYRAIGIVHGTYNAHDENQLNRGVISDRKGNQIESVVLGKALSLMKKHINLENSYFWIVYPKNKSIDNLHLQIAGIWDPYQLNNIKRENLKKDTKELLEELNLKDNYFSIRGELVYINIQKKELVIKICSSVNTKKLKNKNFKLVVGGELPLEILNTFVSLDVIRDGNTLKMVKYEVVKKFLSKK